jgi:hypothetical protein
MLTDMQLDEGAIEEAVASFGRCLKECYNLGLWQTYMRYIKLVRSSQTSSLPHKRLTPHKLSSWRSIEVSQVKPALCHSAGAPLAMCGEICSCCRQMHQRGRQGIWK